VNRCLERELGPTTVWFPAREGKRVVFEGSVELKLVSAERVPRGRGVHM